MANHDVTVEYWERLIPQPFSDIELRPNDTITWTAGSHVSTIEKIAFFEDEAESVAMGFWSRDGSDDDLPPHYSFRSAPDFTWVEATDRETAVGPDGHEHWYRLWARDENGVLRDFDPKVINKPGG